MDEPCPNCARMREERDAALNALAVEREKANAILLSQKLPPPPPEKPVRYWAVDLINDGLKKLPLPRASVRALLQKLRK